MAFCIAKLSPSPGTMSSLIDDPLHWQWLNDPTGHNVYGAFNMLQQKNLLLFDGLQST
jgi:hypothetical protein